VFFLIGMAGRRPPFSSFNIILLWLGNPGVVVGGLATAGAFWLRSQGKSVPSILLRVGARGAGILRDPHDPAPGPSCSRVGN
jgi:hypothetical protein